MSKYIIGTIIGIMFFFLAVWINYYLTKNGKTDEMLYVNCDTFNTQGEAQEYFIKNKATHLDGGNGGEHNGIACEHLPLTTSSPTRRPAISATQTIQPQPTQVIKVEGTAKVIVEATESPRTSDSPEPTSEATSRPTASPEPTSEPTASPTPTPLVCVLGICL